MSNFRWSNFPIPEGHAALLVVGVGLHLWRPLWVFRATRPKQILSWLLLLMGILLAAWAVAAVKIVILKSRLRSYHPGLMPSAGIPCIWPGPASMLRGSANEYLVAHHVENLVAMKGRRS